MSFSTISRRQAILKLLDKKAKLSVTELSQKYGVSGVTIRKDLEVLESEGHLVKTWGGAYRPHTGAEFFRLEERARQHSDEKRQIARLAATLIEDKQCLFLDAGSTLEQMVPQLLDKRKLTVLVSSLRLAIELGKHNRHRIYLIGGQFRPETMDTVGRLSAGGLEHFGNITLFIGVDGLSAKGGLMRDDVEAALLIQSLLPAARRVVALADHSKFGEAGHYRLLGLEQLDVLVTDRQPPPDFLLNAKKQKLRIMY